MMRNFHAFGIFNPKDVKQLGEKGISPKKNYCSIPVPVPSLSTPSSSHKLQDEANLLPPHRYPGPRLPDGTNPYSTYIPVRRTHSLYAYCLFMGCTQTSSSVESFF